MELFIIPFYWPSSEQSASWNVSSVLYI